MSHNLTINIGDKYFNPKAPHLGIRIATKETIDRIAFAKAINYGTCYYTKVN